MYVPEEARKCVAFIYYNSPNGPKIAGTGFFVAVPVERNKEQMRPYFVTAQHVIQIALCNASDDNILLRLNTFDGGSAFGALPINIFPHPRNIAHDVVAIPCCPEVDKYDYLTITNDMFVTEKMLSERTIGHGDEIFITGLFINHVGRNRNLPIVRVGNISAMPEEPISTSRGEIDGFIIEARSIGGLSGSPVFVHIFGRREKEIQLRPQIYLLGLIHGHWDARSNTEDASDRPSNEHDPINMGLAIVTPVMKLSEILFSSDVVIGRNRLAPFDATSIQIGRQRLFTKKTG